MKSKKIVLLPWVAANILIIVGLWLVGIEIGSWRVGGVRWAWGSVLGYVLLVAAAVLMWTLILRAEVRKRH